MALKLYELAAKYKAGTMTDADLEESGYEIHQVELEAESTVLDELVEKYKAGTITQADLNNSGFTIHQVERVAEKILKYGIDCRIKRIDVIDLSPGYFNLAYYDGSTYTILCGDGQGSEGVLPSWNSGFQRDDWHTAKENESYNNDSEGHYTFDSLEHSVYTGNKVIDGTNSFDIYNKLFIVQPSDGSFSWPSFLTFNDDEKPIASNTSVFIFEINLDGIYATAYNFREIGEDELFKNSYDEYYLLSDRIE